jgi:hypothetical protein
MRVKVYRCRTCKAVFDYSPRHHPTIPTNIHWRRYSPYHGKLEHESVKGCPACQHPGELAVGTTND